MDSMNEMMESRGLPTELRVSWRMFFLFLFWGRGRMNENDMDDKDSYQKH